MGFKDILVHVNVSRHCRSRLEVAAHLAKTFDARLTGLFTSALSDIPFFIMEEIESKPAPTMHAWWLMERDRAKSAFDACMGETGCSAHWVEIDDQTARMTTALSASGTGATSATSPW